ncbi:hypothetical protein Tsubulata_035677, partial [Turnera subulata]
ISHVYSREKKERRRRRWWWIGLRSFNHLLDRRFTRNLLDLGKLAHWSMDSAAQWYWHVCGIIYSLCVRHA